MTRIIEVVDYDPVWIDAYQREADQVLCALAPELVSIHPMGSTAVPGLRAKPVIDILVVVRQIERVDVYNPAMQRLGYVPHGEYGIPGRRYFNKKIGEIHTHHVHTFQIGNPEIARHLLFVAYLRAHPGAAQAYAHLKTGLAERFPDDIGGYTDGKTDFIRSIDALTREWYNHQLKGSRFSQPPDRI